MVGKRGGALAINTWSAHDKASWCAVMKAEVPTGSDGNFGRSPNMRTANASFGTEHTSASKML